MTKDTGQRRRGGFTLIELLVVMSIIALLATLAVPRYFQHIDRAEEAVLRDNLHQMRDALDKFYGDNGRYPSALDELVKKRYLRSIPVDPITESATTWVTVAPAAPESGGIADIHSGATGEGRDGTAYSTW